MEPDDLIAIGRFGRAHGVRGEVRFFSQNPQSDLLEDGLRVFVRRDGSAVPLTVAKVRHSAKFDIVGLDEIDGRDAAEALTNLEVFVERDALPEPDADEVYLSDLIGQPVAIMTGDADQTRPIGRVGGFFETGANDVMVVELADGDTLYVPVVDHAIAQMAPDADVVLQPLDEWAPEDTELPDD